MLTYLAIMLTSKNCFFDVKGILKFEIIFEGGIFKIVFE